MDKLQSLYEQLVQIAIQNIPEGFHIQQEENKCHFLVPHNLYPKGYHCNPKQPLPFISIIKQKNHVSLHHLALYTSEQYKNAFLQEYQTHFPNQKLDFGKGCFRFKDPEKTPFTLIANLFQQFNPQQWISLYEDAFRSK